MALPLATLSSRLLTWLNGRSFIPFRSSRYCVHSLSAVFVVSASQHQLCFPTCCLAWTTIQPNQLWISLSASGRAYLSQSHVSAPRLTGSVTSISDNIVMSISIPTLVFFTISWACANRTRCSINARVSSVTKAFIRTAKALIEKTWFEIRLPFVRTVSLVGVHPIPRDFSGVGTYKLPRGWVQLCIEKWRDALGRLYLCNCEMLLRMERKYSGKRCEHEHTFHVPEVGHPTPLEGVQSTYTSSAPVL